MASVLRRLWKLDPTLLPKTHNGQTLFEVIRHLPGKGLGRFVRQTQQLDSVNENTVRKVYKITHVDLAKDPLGKGRAKLQEYVMTPKGFSRKSFKSEYLGIANSGNWEVLYNPTFDWFLSRKMEDSTLRAPLELESEYQSAIFALKSSQLPVEILEEFTNKSRKQEKGIHQAISTFKAQKQKEQKIVDGGDSSLRVEPVPL